MTRWPVVLAVALAGCGSTDGAAGAGGAAPADPTVTVVGEPCCPDPAMLGYSTDFRCFEEGLVCPWIWSDTGAVGGGVVRCDGVRWGIGEDCPDADVATDCPAEGADLGDCDVAPPGGCICVCRDGRGVCVQSADCVEGRWVALTPATDAEAWCAPCSPVTVTAWADGSCTGERTCVRDDHLVECTPTDDGSACDCSVAGAVVGSCLDEARGEAACDVDEGCCAAVLAAR